MKCDHCGREITTCTAAGEVTKPVAERGILDKLLEAIRLAHLNTLDEPVAIRFTEGPARGLPMVKVRQIVEILAHPDDWPELEALGKEEGFDPATTLWGIPVVPPE